MDNRYRQASIIWIIFLIIFLNPIRADIKTTKIAQDNSSKVVMIITFDSHEQPLSIGSGFYISEDGKIATNYHVIEEANSAIVKEIGSDEKTKVDSVVQISAEHDLAIIKINKVTKPLKLGKDETLLVGEKIVSIGNPEGLEGTVSEGIVSGFRSLNEDFRLIQITAPISPGSSGGPVFNSEGELIGIATASIVSGQNLNFAIPISALNKLISEKPLDLKLNQVNFPLLSKKQSQLVYSQEIELIRIIDYSYGTRYVGGSGYFEFSIYNGSQHDIKNIKVIIIFYKNDPNKTITVGKPPVHFEAYDIKEIIPSKLSKRIKKLIDPLDSDWVAHFRVLDYNILPYSEELQFK